MWSKSKRPERDENGFPKMKNAPPPLSKKEFKNMQMLVADAEKYDNAGNTEMAMLLLMKIEQAAHDYKMNIYQKLTPYDNPTNPHNNKP